MGMDELRAAWDLWGAERQGTVGVSSRREARLASLVAYARARSPYYRDLYRGLPSDVALTDLPRVGKLELMAAFDEWVTDGAVTRAGVEGFTADFSGVGSPYLGRYFVCSSSGTTGLPGLFVHDRDAVAVYRSLGLRGEIHWLSGRQWLTMIRRGGRWAAVLAAGGHFAAVGWLEMERRRDRFRSKAYRVVSVQGRLEELVGALNAFDPATLTAYPSMLGLLADEQAAGRLRVHPTLIETGGESMTTRPGTMSRHACAPSSPTRTWRTSPSVGPRTLRPPTPAVASTVTSWSGRGSPPDHRRRRWRGGGTVAS